VSAAHSRSCWCRQLWHIVGLDSISACKTLTLMLASKVVSLAAADRTVSPIARASLPRVLLGAGSTAALLQLSACCTPAACRTWPSTRRWRSARSAAGQHSTGHCRCTPRAVPGGQREIWWGCWARSLHLPESERLAKEGKSRSCCLLVHGWLSILSSVLQGAACAALLQLLCQLASVP